MERGWCNAGSKRHHVPLRQAYEVLKAAALWALRVVSIGQFPPVNSIILKYLAAASNKNESVLLLKCITLAQCCHFHSHWDSVVLFLSLCFVELNPRKSPRRSLDRIHAPNCSRDTFTQGGSSGSEDFSCRTPTLTCNVLPPHTHTHRDQGGGVKHSDRVLKYITHQAVLLKGKGCACNTPG